MHTLADVVPDLLAETAAALSSQGRGESARQLEVGMIERVRMNHPSMVV
jgi:hypothetical protein